MFGLKCLQESGLKEGLWFGTKEDVRQHLIDYHSQDSLSDLSKMSLEELLDYGDWELLEKGLLEITKKED